MNTFELFLKTLRFISSVEPPITHHDRQARQHRAGARRVFPSESSPGPGSHTVTDERSPDEDG